MSNTNEKPAALICTADQRVPIVVRFSRAQMIFITVVLVFYFGTITVWNIPESFVKSKLQEALRIPVDFFAIEQTWNMFAPEIRRTNQYITAVITFEDGSAKLYEAPRMEKMGLFEKYGKEKMRKLFVDNVPTAAFENYLPDMCASLARANYDKNNPPKLVTMTFQAADIPEPNRTSLLSRFEMPQQVKSQTLIVYRVQRRDLDSP